MALEVQSLPVWAKHHSGGGLKSRLVCIRFEREAVAKLIELLPPFTLSLWSKDRALHRMRSNPRLQATLTSGRRPLAPGPEPHRYASAPSPSSAWSFTPQWQRSVRWCRKHLHRTSWHPGFGSSARWIRNAEPVFQEVGGAWDAIGQRPRGRSSVGPMSRVAVESSSEAACQRLGSERGAG